MFLIKQKNLIENCLMRSFIFDKTPLELETYSTDVAEEFLLSIERILQRNFSLNVDLLESI